jgi:hypothetical protein
MFRSGRTRPAHAQSSGSETSLRIRFLAGYIIGTLDSRFRKRHLMSYNHEVGLAATWVGLASNHPRLAVRLYNLAGFLYDGKRFAEAEPLYRRALAIDEASYGPDNPMSRTTSGTLPNCFSSRTASWRPSRCTGEGAGERTTLSAPEACICVVGSLTA